MRTVLLLLSAAFCCAAFQARPAVEVVGIKRLDDTVIRRGGNGDNWHMTWADDDAMFVSLNDGTGWSDVPGYDKTSYNSRVYRLNGVPPSITFEHLPGYPQIATEPPLLVNRYYGFGILSLDKKLYHFLSTPNHFFKDPGARFTGIKLIYSEDSGRTWKNQNRSSPVVLEPWEQRSRANMLFFNEPEDGPFSLITVLQMGRNYQHNKDGFVYLFSPNGNTDGTMNQLVLARVKKDRITDRSAYEFFEQRDDSGRAKWTRDIAKRGVVHTFPSGWVNVRYHPYSWHPSVVYNAPLGVYMMANWGMASSPDDGMWFHKPSYLGFWIAANPWGPWKQIHEEKAWTPGGDQNARCYQPQIAPKWIAADGRSFWLVWTDFQLTPEKKRPYYAFNLQKVEIVTK